MHPMLRDPRRKMGPLIYHKSNSQDRLIEELQGKLGIARKERPRKQPDDWLTEGVIVMNNPKRSREDRSGPEVDKVEKEGRGREKSKKERKEKIKDSISPFISSCFFPCFYFYFLNLSSFHFLLLLLFLISSSFLSFLLLIIMLIPSLHPPQFLLFSSSSSSSFVDNHSS